MKPEEYQVALAIQQLEELELPTVFNPDRPELALTPVQKEILEDWSVYQKYIICGNRCKPWYSLVSMADGTQRPISEVKTGEWVLSFDTATETIVASQVTVHHFNGKRDVYRYWAGTGMYTDSTPNHKMVEKVGVYWQKRRIDKCASLTGFGEDSETWATKKITKNVFIGQMDVYDITVDHPDHNYICDGFVTSNSGKSQLGARVVSWWFEENHPFMERPDEWGHGPLKIIVMGQKLEQIDSELWTQKIARYLPKWKIEDRIYKVIRVGQAIQKVINTENGNTIIFQSHNNLTQARKDIQAHTAHVVWLDEMPASVSLFAEIRMRLLANRGVLMATFTPLIRCVEVKELIEATKPPIGRKYIMHMLDNPIFKGREKEVLAQFEGMSEAERRARLYGEWYMGAHAVIDFDASRYIEFPHGYSPKWRHLELVDPASTANFGFLLAAENPDTHVWYVTKSELMKGEAPSKLVQGCIERCSKVNRIAGVTDTAADWYVKEAKEAGVKYRGPKKVGRKDDMIEDTKQALFDGYWKISPECTDLLGELSQMQWSEAQPGKIVNSRKYHCSHALFYGIDLSPAPEKEEQKFTWQEWLIKADEKRQKAEVAKEGKARSSRTSYQPFRKSRRWSRNRNARSML